MEININTSGFGLEYNMNTSFSVGGTLSVPLEEPTEQSAYQRLQEHLNAIKEVFFAEDYDDKAMGHIVEDHLIAIQEILDAERF